MSTATVNAGIWILVSMPKLASGKTSFCPARDTRREYDPLLVAENFLGHATTAGNRPSRRNTSIACLPADRRVGMTACSSGAGPWR